MKKIIDNNENVTSNSKQVEVLKKNFPNCFDKDGKFLSEKLISIINDEVEISNESYELNWLGKKYAKLLANQEVTTMLTEDIEHNTKPENINSQNLYLEGDNLEVLKHMVNSYSNQIKMIYIDPPYNTGTDFIYKDDRKFTIEELSNLANVDEEEAKRILEFTESNSNSHSAWLTFMYPRLYVARELLKADGVIYISIDDNENTQLKLLMDEIFGAENHVATLPVVMNLKGNQDQYGFAGTHEYVYCYSKNKNVAEFNLLPETDSKKLKEWKQDEFGIYKKAGLLSSGENASRKKRPNLFFPIYVEDNCKISLVKTQNSFEILPINEQGDELSWRWSKEKIEKEPFNIFVENGNVYRKIRSKDNLPKKKAKSILLEPEYSSGNGTNILKKLFENKKVFPYSKPIKLLEDLSVISSNDNDIILDFFSGSASTAHAIMNLNAKYNSKRKFIMVQLPEKISLKANGDAYKMCKEELKDEAIIPTIAKERIRRAEKLIKEINSDKEYIHKLDFGFKVFKTKSFIDTNYFNNLYSFDSNQTELLVTNSLSHEDLSDLLLTWKLHDGIDFTKTFNELMLDDYIVHYIEDKAYFMYKDFTNRNIIQLLEELDNIESDFAARNLIIFATNFTSKEQRELVEALKGYKNKKKIELNIELRY